MKRLITIIALMFTIVISNAQSVYRTYDQYLYVFNINENGDIIDKSQTEVGYSVVSIKDGDINVNREDGKEFTYKVYQREATENDGHKAIDAMAIDKFGVKCRILLTYYEEAITMYIMYSNVAFIIYLDY